LSLTIDHCTAESSAKEVERIILGDYLVNSKLLLGRSIADNDGYETLGLRRAMVCQKKKLESRVDYGRRGFETALKKRLLTRNEDASSWTDKHGVCYWTEGGQMKLRKT
jgi:hypothetical protein